MQARGTVSVRGKARTRQLCFPGLTLLACQQLCKLTCPSLTTCAWRSHLCLCILHLEVIKTAVQAPLNELSGSCTLQMIYGDICWRLRKASQVPSLARRFVGQMPSLAIGLLVRRHFDTIKGRTQSGAGRLPVTCQSDAVWEHLGLAVDFLPVFCRSSAIVRSVASWSTFRCWSLCCHVNDT